MKKMKLDIQMFAVKVREHSFTEVANSYNEANKTIQVRYILKLYTTSSSYNNNTITTTYYIDGTKYTVKHKLPKTTDPINIFDKTVTIPCSSNRTVNASYSVPTGISAGTMTGSKSLAIKARIQPSTKIKIKKTLPAGYTQVEYLNSNAAYIETGYYPKSTTKIVASYQFNAVTPVQMRIFGEGGGNLYFCHYINGGGGWSWTSQNSSGNWTAIGITADTNRHEFILDNKNNAIVFDQGTYVDYMATTHSNTSTVTLALGAYHNEDGTYVNIANMKIYYYYLYENDVLIRAWIPCYRNSDGVAGLYDIVNNQFYSSASGTNYGVGPVVSGGFWIDGRVYGKANGTWTAAVNTYAKSSGAWSAAHKVY